MNAAIVPRPNLPRVNRAVLRALLSAHPLPHIRVLRRPFEQVLTLLQLGPADAYQNEGPGFKLGHTNNLDRRLAQYRVCGNTILTSAYFPTSNRMIAERVIFLLFHMLGAKAPCRPCPGCDVCHQEFFNLNAAGGWALVLAVVQLGIIITGGVFLIYHVPAVVIICNGKPCLHSLHLQVYDGTCHSPIIRAFSWRGPPLICAATNSYT
ncbi:hypothetical protein B0H17DRAFT_1200457 [Mycena rosella]|uniref:Bacteriophage T5 Orf172 DNA-binding domain-containing protein n=1 Tax=Mycena rosella TaxID=1033263 RepID=A0AAD7GFF9_MYCRO|nr:hypothetical protein B0H17DRAFT_1200457 [Mycena rosella]